MENLLKYEAFVKTVETGSFTRAAEALNYAQSSVSKMIGDLEREWGASLLERSRAGVCLTSAGEQILPRIRTLLHDQQELEGYVDQLHGVQTGMVRTGPLPARRSTGCRISSRSSRKTVPASSARYCWEITMRWSGGSGRDGWISAFCAGRLIRRWIRSF